MYFDVPKVVRSPGYDYGHDEESRNGRDIKIDILDGYIWTPEKVPEKFGAPGGYRNPPGGIWALLGPCRRKREGAREGGAPPKPIRIGKGAGRPFPFSFPLFLLLLLVLLPNTSTLSFPLQIR